MSYQFRTKPFTHQREVFERSHDMKAFAGFWEQGTGKTKFALDTGANLFQEGEIDAMLVVAPNAVHREWLGPDALLKHFPEDLLEQTKGVSFLSDKATTKYHQKAIAEFLATRDQPHVLTMSYSGFMTKRGKKVAWDLLRTRRVLMVLDESTEIKTPGAKRTLSMVAAGRYPAYKRILDGTPVSNSPFDVYAPIRFLDPDYWKRHAIGTAGAFRHTFGVYAQTRDGDMFPTGDYKNLHVLHEWIQPISSRVLKKDVLDLPPKMYSTVRFDMTAEQRRIYDELKREYRTVLESGEEVTAELTIVRQLRLQQVACGYLPTPIEEGQSAQPVHLIGDRNPRLDTLIELLDFVPHPAIVWARFQLDIDQIMKRLGDRAVRLDGKVDSDGRERAKARFRAGDVQFLISNPAVGGVGLTLNEAKSMFYYSNNFKLRERLQSEDRNHRIGQDVSVGITDLIANDTIDDHIVKSLRKKYEVACEVTGDQVLEWL